MGAANNFIALLSGTLLGALLAWAVWTDVKSRRISNKLILAGSLTAFTLHILLPPGAGLFAENPGALGFLKSFAGFAVGLALLMPPYLLRTMGAGDVKLMAMVGAFVGSEIIVGVTLTTLLVGGVLALVFASFKGTLSQVLGNLRYMFTFTLVKAMSGGGAKVEGPLVSTGKLPYAIAIAVGTLLYLFVLTPRGWLA